MTGSGIAIKIRESKPEDRQAIFRVHEAAFGRADEAKLVDKLFDSGHVIDNLSLVATVESEIVGHVLYTKVRIIYNGLPMMEDSDPPYGIALAPLAVLPSFQKQSVGKALMHESMKKADETGHGMIIVLGHPEYYPKFGFKPASGFGMYSPFDVPDNVFMVKPLAKYDEKVRGDVRYHEAFNQLD